MAQGTIKNRKVNPLPPKKQNPKKGHRTIAPKKAKLVKQNKITKRYTAGLTGKTERGLAERAGHLEMLGGGKKGGKGSLEGGKSKRGEEKKKDGK